MITAHPQNGKVKFSQTGGWVSKEGGSIRKDSKMLVGVLTIQVQEQVGHDPWLLFVAHARAQGSIVHCLQIAKNWNKPLY